jgi:hypothetical protein
VSHHEGHDYGAPRLTKKCGFCGSHHEGHDYGALAERSGSCFLGSQSHYMGHDYGAPSLTPIAGRFTDTCPTMRDMIMVPRGHQL